MDSEIFVPRVNGGELINNYFRITWQMTSQIVAGVAQENAASRPITANVS